MLETLLNKFMGWLEAFFDASWNRIHDWAMSVWNALQPTFESFVAAVFAYFPDWNTGTGLEVKNFFFAVDSWVPVTFGLLALSAYLTSWATVTILKWLIKLVPGIG